MSAFGPEWTRCTELWGEKEWQEPERISLADELPAGVEGLASIPEFPLSACAVHRLMRSTT